MTENKVIKAVIAVLSILLMAVKLIIADRIKEINNKQNRGFP